MGFIKLDDEYSIRMRKKELQAKAESEKTSSAPFGSPVHLESSEGSEGPGKHMERIKNMYIWSEMAGKRLEFKIDELVHRFIASGQSHRYEFAYRAGKTWGSRPKPDTHIISCKVSYTNLDSEGSEPHPKQVQQSYANMEIAIFPSFTTMLVGTLVGSLLGTSAKQPFFSRIMGGEDFSLGLTLSDFLINLILAFVAGVVLMRRKDVQSFITIEDFWGGLLVGFVIGFTGYQGLTRLLGGDLLPPTDNQTATDNANTLFFNSTVFNITST